MIAVFLSPLYFLGTWLLTFMFLRWLSVCSEKGRMRRFFNHRIVKAIVFFLTFCMSLQLPIGFLLEPCREKYFLLHIGSAWMGVLMYALFFAGIYLLYCLIWRLWKKTKRPGRVAVVMGAGVLAATVAVCVYGFFNAAKIRTTEYSVEIEKASEIKELNAVMVADLHLGYNVGCPEMRQMVEKINECKPDIVFICGDIFDNDVNAMDNPLELAEILASIDTVYGVYACYGNHDIDERVLAGFTFDYDGVKESSPQMDEFLKKAGISLLMDEGVLIGDCFYVYGRPDYSKPGRGIEARKTAAMISEEIDMEYPVIVLDHEPKDIDALSEEGFDLVLSGHTHDGQIFPANILVSMLYGNSYGYSAYGNTHEIVTSGVGLFGPYMRVGTVSEICNIRITMKE